MQIAYFSSHVYLKCLLLHHAHPFLLWLLTGVLEILTSTPGLRENRHLISDDFPTLLRPIKHTWEYTATPLIYTREAGEEEALWYSGNALLHLRPNIESVQGCNVCREGTMKSQDDQGILERVVRPSVSKNGLRRRDMALATGQWGKTHRGKNKNKK